MTTTERFGMGPRFGLFDKKNGGSWNGSAVVFLGQR